MKCSNLFLLLLPPLSLSFSVLSPTFLSQTLPLSRSRPLTRSLNLSHPHPRSTSCPLAVYLPCWCLPLSRAKILTDLVGEHESERRVHAHFKIVAASVNYHAS